MFVTNNSGVMCEDGSDGNEELLLPVHDLLDEAAYVFYADAPRPANTVMSASDELPQAFEYEEPALGDDDFEFYWAQGPPIPDTVMSADIRARFPDQPEEPEDEDFGHVSFTIGREDGADQVGRYFPDQSEEPEDEDLANLFVDFQIGREDGADLVARVFPDQSEEPEDEDFGFAFLGFAIGTEDGADQVFTTFPDQPEEPEDEDFGHIDFQIPADLSTGIADQYFPAEAEDEEEVVGFEFTLQDDDQQGAVSLADLVEDEDEDFGFSDSQLPPDAVVVDTGIADQQFAAEVEDEEEAEGFASGIVGDEVAPVPTAPPVSSGIAMPDVPRTYRSPQPLPDFEPRVRPTLVRFEPRLRLPTPTANLVVEARAVSSIVVSVEARLPALRAVAIEVEVAEGGKLFELLAVIEAARRRKE